jgi:hypothetical protein
MQVRKPSGKLGYGAVQSRWRRSSTAKIAFEAFVLTVFYSLKLSLAMMTNGHLNQGSPTIWMGFQVSARILEYSAIFNV